MEKKYPGRRAIPVGGIFFLSVYIRLFNPGKRYIFVTKLKPRKKSYCFLIVNKDGCCESENHCPGNSYDNVINVFVGWPLLYLENENEADRNNIMLYF